MRIKGLVEFLKRVVICNINELFLNIAESDSDPIARNLKWLNAFRKKFVQGWLFIKVYEFRFRVGLLQLDQKEIHHERSEFQ